MNKSSHVLCKYCKKSYIPRPCDLDKHISTKKHKDAEQNDKQKLFSEFAAGKKVARAEILWSFFTIYRNLSFNLSEYAGFFLQSMFPDSNIASSISINRKKNKKNYRKCTFKNG